MIIVLFVINQFHVFVLNVNGGIVLNIFWIIKIMLKGVPTLPIGETVTNEFLRPKLDLFTMWQSSCF